LIFLFRGGDILSSENYPLNSCLKNGLIQANLDYPDSTVVDYPAIVPLASYTTEKGRALAQKYKKQLIQIIKILTKRYPRTQMEIRAVGFLKSPQGGEKDERYLSVIMEVSEEYEIGDSSFKKRVAKILKKYIDSIAMILLEYEAILKDKDVEGVAICPNWMLKRTQKVSDKKEMSEGVFVCINNKIGKEFFQKRIDLSQLATQVKTYGRQGDKIFDLDNMQIKSK
jgi:hypothetical protein